MARKLLRREGVVKGLHACCFLTEKHTQVILLCILEKYFSCVLESSSCPPAMAKIMASAMRLSCKQRSTALSKLPVSKAWVIKPSTSATREECIFKWWHKSHLNMQQQLILPSCTTLHKILCKPACFRQVLTGMFKFISSLKHTMVTATPGGALSSIVYLAAEQDASKR